MSEGFAVNIDIGKDWGGVRCTNYLLILTWNRLLSEVLIMA
ncbi:hypothetical protein ETAE_2038 [Edwardsiella piscicida]|uniref:Uncharacterized protein n=1 Tax=Edwardsiella piscicida TaxID=1263550 RepID=A0AAU8P438_EDWPI|nr:hypothetical protein ETAE_2038 [Edwardsiella tarda EIB202]